MPLHSENPLGTRSTVGFDKPFLGIGFWDQSFCQAIHRLMVKAVGQQFFLPLIDFRQTAAGNEVHLVAEGMAAILLLMGRAGKGGGDILMQRSAQDDIQNLHSAANGQDGHLAGKSLLNEGELHVIPVRIDAAALGRGLLAIAPGIHIHAAGEDKPIQSSHQGGHMAQRDIVMQGDEIGVEAIRGPEIALGHVLFTDLVIKIGWDTDAGSFHCSFFLLIYTTAERGEAYYIM